MPITAKNNRGRFKTSELDDDVLRCSVVGVEYEALPKAPLLT